jgi:hypothetical protein
MKHIFACLLKVRFFSLLQFSNELYFEALSWVPSFLGNRNLSKSRLFTIIFAPNLTAQTVSSFIFNKKNDQLFFGCIRSGLLYCLEGEGEGKGVRV